MSLENTLKSFFESLVLVGQNRDNTFYTENYGVVPMSLSLFNYYMCVYVCTQAREKKTKKKTF